MSNFWKRTLFGALFVVVVMGAVLIGEYTLLALLTLITILGLRELYTLCEMDEIFPQKAAGIILGIYPFIITFTQHGLNDFIRSSIYAIGFIFPFLIFIFELFRRKNKPFINIAITFFGILYISIPLFIFYIISIYPSDGNWLFGGWKYNPRTLLGYFFILWSYDTGAYLAGSRFGKHKLWERLSPKKTWEGVIGGAVLALIIAYICSIYFTAFSRTDWFIITMIIMITGTLGDLVKSMFKRSINIKDSGNIIPGHGGILDRFDALFLSTPFVFLYLFISK